MKFLTQGPTRGLFRNPDVRPAKLKITRFLDTRGSRTSNSHPLFHCLEQMNDMERQDARQSA